METHFWDSDCQKSASKEWIWVLNWNFQRMLKGEELLTKR
jgi:hypothetical protein